MEFSKPKDGSKHLVQVDLAAIGCASPDERQQIAYNLTRASGLAPDDLQIAPQRWRRCLVHHPLARSDDRLQRIVDLVCHARDELADGRQPLAVDELIA